MTDTVEQTIKLLVDEGRPKGFLTYAEMSKLMEDQFLPPDKMDQVFIGLEDAGEACRFAGACTGGSSGECCCSFSQRSKVVILMPSGFIGCSVSLVPPMVFVRSGSMPSARSGLARLRCFAMTQGRRAMPSTHTKGTDGAMTSTPRGRWKAIVPRFDLT